jgi:hypothetical protein
MGILRLFFAHVAGRALPAGEAGSHLCPSEPLANPSLTTAHPSVTLARIIAGVKAENGTGFCAKCGNEQTGCQPLSRHIKCTACGCSSVFEADEAFMAFSLNDSGAELQAIPPGP